MKLNKEELIIGFIFGIAFSPIIHWWSLVIAPFTSIFWAISGSEWKYNFKLWRRLGVPLIACTVVYLVTKNWHIWVSLPFAFAILSMGYGIPDSTDEGSTLGKFWYRISPQYANILTRGTIYLLLTITFCLGIFIK